MLTTDKIREVNEKSIKKSPFKSHDFLDDSTLADYLFNSTKTEQQNRIETLTVKESHSLRQRLSHRLFKKEYDLLTFEDKNKIDDIMTTVTSFLALHFSRVAESKGSVSIASLWEMITWE